MPSLFTRLSAQFRQRYLNMVGDVHTIPIGHIVVRNPISQIEHDDRGIDVIEFPRSQNSGFLLAADIPDLIPHRADGLEREQSYCGQRPGTYRV